MAYTTIDNPALHFNAVTWTGTGDATTTVSGVGFQPDWVWIKNRSVGDDHALFDAVRGVEKILFSNATNAESTNTESLTAFNADGFVTGNHRATGGDSGNGMVSWNWLGANGTASNSDGSITSTVSANTTAGFSIVRYTGTGSNATVGHGLGVAPNVYIVKSLSGGGDWTSYHSVLGNTKFLRLNSTIAAGTQSSYWNDTSPTSTVFSLGTAGDTNTNSGTHVAYCFADKKGYSKFGSYTGNGNAAGPFVYTGFKPAFVIAKISSDANDWFMFDNKRSAFNPMDDSLYPNTSAVENTNHIIDFLSNGFKIRDSDGTVNSTGNTYIYMAFAENPFVTVGTKAAGTAR